MKAGRRFAVLGSLPLLGFSVVFAVLRAEESPPPKVNLNTANVEELAQLPGIGPAIAERIVRHREKNGPFRRIEELLIIRGISRKKFEKIRPLIFVQPEPVGKRTAKPSA